MKLEIELDLNKIDYDAINKQIQEKLENMNLEETYQINSRINSKIDEEVESKIRLYLTKRGWGCEDLNDTVKTDVLDEINRDIKSVVEPIVDEVFSKISSEDLNKLISDLRPKILIDVIMNNTGSSFYSYCEDSRATTLNIAEDRIRQMLQNRGY